MVNLTVLTKIKSNICIMNLGVHGALMGKEAAMYVTILTGRVARENWITLAHLFERRVTRNPPVGLMKSCLIQSEDDPSHWRIVSMWSQKTDYENYASTNRADAYIELMCDTGTVPDRHGYLSQGWYEQV